MIFFRDFFSSNLDFVCSNLVVYQVSTIYYVWNWSKSLWWVVVVVCKPIIVFSLSSSWTISECPNECSVLAILQLQECTIVHKVDAS